MISFKSVQQANEQERDFFKADPDFIFQKPSYIVMTLGLEGIPALFQSCLEKEKAYGND